MDETAALETVLCQSIDPFFHGMIWQAFDFLCLDRDFGISPRTAAVFSIALIGVDLMEPVVILRAWFWTLSSTCWLVFAVVDLAVEPYSRWGWTAPW